MSCEAEFDNEANERCLRGHTSSKWCRKRQDMTEAQQRARRLKLDEAR